MTPQAARHPRPEYRVRIDWTCDPARTAMLVRRVFDDIEFLKHTPLSTGQMTALRESLQREFEKNSQENAYLLSLISRRYEDGGAADLGAALNLPARIAALTGEAIQRAAQQYLDTGEYVKVTLMPEGK